MHKLSILLLAPFSFSSESNPSVSSSLVLKLMICCRVLQTIISLLWCCKQSLSNTRRKIYRGNINQSLSALQICIMLLSIEKVSFYLHSSFVSFCLAKNCLTGFLVSAKKVSYLRIFHSKNKSKNWLLILLTPPIRAFSFFSHRDFWIVRYHSKLLTPFRWPCVSSE